MTTANAVAAQFDNDGSVFRDRHGSSLMAVCRILGATEVWRDGHHVGDVVRFTFPDGSVLTVAGEGWDLGYPSCFCWQGAGHLETCEAIS